MCTKQMQPSFLTRPPQLVGVPEGYWACSRWAMAQNELWEPTVLLKTAQAGRMPLQVQHGRRDPKGSSKRSPRQVQVLEGCRPTMMRRCTARRLSGMPLAYQAALLPCRHMALQSMYCRLLASSNRRWAAPWPSGQHRLLASVGCCPTPSCLTPTSLNAIFGHSVSSPDGLRRIKLILLVTGVCVLA